MRHVSYLAGFLFLVRSQSHETQQGFGVGDWGPVCSAGECISIEIDGEILDCYVSAIFVWPGARQRHAGAKVGNSDPETACQRVSDAGMAMDTYQGLACMHRRLELCDLWDVETPKPRSIIPVLFLER